MTSLYWLILGSFSAWRVTHALHAEAGPANVFANLRETLGGIRFFRALDCFYCLSVWVALPIAWLIGETFGEVILLWFGLSGAACLLERFERRDFATPALYWEMKGDEK